MTKFKDQIVTSAPGVCGGHATLKGHRIEVSNLVADLAFRKMSISEWIELFKAGSWITEGEIIAALKYCSRKHCLHDGITCCHCTLNPEEGADAEDDPYNGWELAIQALEKHRE